MQRRRSRRWWSRHALALWFGALALLAVLRVVARVMRGGPLDATTLAWLIGAALLAATGAAIALRHSRVR